MDVVCVYLACLGSSPEGAVPVWWFGEGLKIENLKLKIFEKDSRTE